MKRIVLGILPFLYFSSPYGFGESKIDPENEKSGSKWNIEWSELEGEMLHLINKERKTLEAQPLKMDSLTRLVARNHSLDMSRRDYVGHNSPEGKTLKDRIFEADVYAEEYGENVGKHMTMTGAHQGLMESIRHRKNILKPSFTHVGIGILRGENGYLYITQNFIKKIDPIDLETSKTQIFWKLNLIEDQNLSTIAKEHTRKIFDAGEIQLPLPDLEFKARFFTWRGPKLVEFLEIEEVKDANGPRAGVGILQGSSRKHGTGLLWITLIIAE